MRCLVILFVNVDHHCQFWNVLKLLSTPSTTPALFGGGLLGYVIYDVTHYYVHHGQPTRKIPKRLKVRVHHYLIFIS